MEADEYIETSLSGVDLLGRPLLNKGTAFTEAERDAFELHGLLPPHIGSLDQQIARRLKAIRACDDALERYAMLRDLQDVNETLYYAMLERFPEELLPIVYTPTVGEGCQRFSEIWRRPRGVFLSYPNRHRIRDILASPHFDDVEVIVVSDGERILGLGDQGTGGMGIPIGKLALYTACAGIHPKRTLPVFLDVGTDNQARLDDPLYVGWRSPRVRGAEYDAFVEEFVSAAASRWPNLLLQWEDFANQNAGRLLDAYRDRLCSFNDDIQGTAAVAAGTLFSAIAVTGVPLVEQRIALVGAGSAGCGIASLLRRAMIAEGLSPDEASRRFFAIDRDGLLVEGVTPLRPEQSPFAQARESVARWSLERPGSIGLIDVARNAAPTVLIGVSGQPGAFDEASIREIATRVDRPILCPLSNPTSRAEATAEDLVRWTDGRALVGTGSPFAAVRYGDRTIAIAQTNNAYVFPGIGLGVLASRARRVSDAIFTAAARALADLSPAKDDPDAPLLPPVRDLRRVARIVALAVGRQAIAEGLAPECGAGELERAVDARMWEPRYLPYRRVSAVA